MANIGLKGALAYGSYTGSTFTGTPIEKPVKIKLPAPEVSDIDITTLDQTDYWKRFEGGMIDPGTLDVECHFTATNYSNIFEILGETHTWQFVHDGDEGITMHFDAFVKKPEAEFSLDDKVTVLTVALKLTGSITLED